MDTFRFADVTVGWDAGGFRLRTGEYTDLFTCEAVSEPDVLIRCGVEPLAPYEECKKLASAYLYDTYEKSGEVFRLFNWAHLRHAYAVFPDRLAQGDPECCLFDPALERQPPLPVDWLLSICGLHKVLLLREKPMLHASYIAVDGGAILFAAPSGTGKSTQADLWQRCTGAEIINGDRVLLGKRNDRWYAHGFPSCGTSGICLNKSLTLRAIVLLSQGNENRIEPVQNAVKRLVSGMVVTPWDPQQLEAALTLAEDITGSVPIFGYAARNDATAVSVLREYLEANNL